MKILGQFWFVLVHFESVLVLPKVGISKILISNILEHFFEKLVRCRYFSLFLPKILDFQIKSHLAKNTITKNINRLDQRHGQRELCSSVLQTATKPMLVIELGQMMQLRPSSKKKRKPCDIQNYYNRQMYWPRFCCPWFSREGPICTSSIKQPTMFWFHGQFSLCVLQSPEKYVTISVRTHNNLMARQLVTGHSFSDDQKIAKGNSTHAKTKSTNNSCTIGFQGLVFIANLL